MRLAALIILLFALSASFAGCKRIVEPENKSISVYATFWPIYAMTDAAMEGIPDAELKLLVQPQDGCLRNYQLSDWDAALLSADADAIIMGGRGLESFEGLLFGWERALYSIIFQYASTQIIHLLNNRYKKNTLLIITDHPEEMIRCLNRDVRHGVTEMHVMGTYKEQERTMLYSVISNSELKMVLRDLHETDPHAFINVIKTEQVNGRFYIKPND